MTKTSETSGLRQAVQISATYFIEGNIGNKGKLDRIKQALTIFVFEDELLIKLQTKKKGEGITIVWHRVG